MSIDIILVIGLPASGKSTLVLFLMDKDEDMICLQDPMEEEHLHNIISRCIHFNKNLIITDPYLCNPKHLEKAKKVLKNHNVKLIFFKNDVEKCFEISKNRINKKVKSLILFLSKIYNPPEKSIPIGIDFNSINISDYLIDV